jgi:hypothetical protein
MELPALWPSVLKPANQVSSNLMLFASQVLGSERAKAPLPLFWELYESYGSRTAGFTQITVYKDRHDFRLD